MVAGALLPVGTVSLVFPAGILPMVAYLSLPVGAGLNLPSKESDVPPGVPAGHEFLHHNYCDFWLFGMEGRDASAPGFVCCCGFLGWALEHTTLPARVGRRNGLPGR
jgi:hypothetical protein